MPDRVLKLHEVEERTGCRRSFIYAKARCGEFPSPIKLSRRSSGWLESEVDSWVKARVTASRKTEPGLEAREG
jgi:prophage regulatory protein